MLTETLPDTLSLPRMLRYTSMRRTCCAWRHLESTLVVLLLKGPGAPWLCFQGVMEAQEKICSLRVGWAFCQLGKVRVLVVQMCPTFCHPMDCSQPGSLFHGILQARILEWVAILQGNFSTQETNPGLHCRLLLYHLSHREALAVAGETLIPQLNPCLWSPCELGLWETHRQGPRFDDGWRLTWRWGWGSDITFYHHFLHPFRINTYARLEIKEQPLLTTQQIVRASASTILLPNLHREQKESLRAEQHDSAQTPVEARAL